MQFLNNKKCIQAVLFLFLLLAISFSYIARAKAGTRYPMAPNFSLKVINPKLSGYKNFTLSSFRGHIVIINFWATYNPFKSDIATFERFYKSELPNKIIVVGINVNQSRQRRQIVRSFVKNQHITYPIVFDGYGRTKGWIENDYNVNETPQTFFISKNGHVVFRWVGSISAVNLYQIINKMLLGLSM